MFFVFGKMLFIFIIVIGLGLWLVFFCIGVIDGFGKWFLVENVMFFIFFFIGCKGCLVLIGVWIVKVFGYFFDRYVVNV